MTDRTDLFEAAFDSLPEGVVLSTEEGDVVLWNRAAEAILGYSRAEVLGKPERALLDALVVGGIAHWMAQTDAPASHRTVIHGRHKLGHELAVMTRVLVLRDEMGSRIGTAVMFHPAESLDALPHGSISEGSRVGESQIELEDRLEAEFEDFTKSGEPLGVLWITVDQAHDLRKTHGTRACVAMLEKVEQTLAVGLRPTEEMGRWGDDEFLVVSHERTSATLAAHAQVLAGMARTADFRWWGDRISLSVSIGAAQAESGEKLKELLDRAQGAMIASIHEGGNHITSAPGRTSCLPS